MDTKIDFCDLPSLESCCYKCYGKGKIKIKPEGKKCLKTIDCPSCHGEPYKLTEFGQAIIEIVEKYGFIKKPIGKHTDVT